LGLAVTELDKPNTSERRARDSIRQVYEEIFSFADTKSPGNG
jgi:hypothetical protein